MKIWLDTVDIDVVAEGAKLGIVAGVTTNPSILANTKNVPDTLRKLLDVQPGPVAVQVTSNSFEKIIEEAHAIFHFSNRLLIKIPITRNGLMAIKELKKEGIPILGTGILFVTQALLAAHQEITSIAPYFSHMENSFETLKTMVEVIQKSESPTKVLVASLKQIEHLIFCASLGVDAVTIKHPLYQQLVADHPVVEDFSNRFFSDWMKTHGPISIKDALV